MVNLFLVTNFESQQWIMIAVWVVVIILAVIVEVESAELISIWFALGALVGLALALLNVNLYVQFAASAATALIAIIATRPLVKKLTKNEIIKTNADRLIGKIAIVTKEIKENEKGEVKVNYQEWTAITNDEAIYPVGTKVLIKEIVGNKLVITNIEEIEII